jgi:hypothetical protein
MDKKKNCKVTACFTTHRRELVGGFFLLMATLLTILTFSGIGIFGMFIAGMALCCHKHWCCRNCTCGCCSSTEMEESCSTTNTPSPKKPAVKKVTKA